MRTPTRYGRLLPLFLFALAVSAAPAQAQLSELRFEHLSLDQGLSQSTVNAIAQDGRGFLWFGTQDGLNRFDGYSVTVFKHSSQDTNSLADNTIWSLARDNTGDLWVGTMRGGLNRFLIDENRFIRYRHDPYDTSSLSDNNVTALFVDSRGILWVGTMTNGLSRFDAQTGRFIHYRHDPHNPHSLSDNTVWAICEDSSGDIWVATWGGLSRCTPPQPGQSMEQLEFRRYRNNPAAPFSLSGNHVRTLFADRNKTLWVGTWGDGLNRYDPATDRFVRYQQGNRAGLLSSNLILSLFEDSRGILWVGTGDAGLNRYHARDNVFVTYRHDPSNPGSMNNDIVCSLYEDRAGALWVGTGAGGINRYDPFKNRFAHYRDNQGNPDDLTGNDVWAILESRAGELWIGTYGNGLNRLNRARTEVRHYANVPGDPSSLSHNNILSLCETRDGMLWVGTEGGGLNRLDPRTGRCVVYRRVPGNPASISQDEITVLCEDRRGYLWIGTNGSGVDRMDPATGRCIHLHPGGGPDGITSGAIIALREDGRGALWIGTMGGGVNRYDGEGRAVVRYPYGVDDSTGLNNNTVLSIYEDSAGTIWFGTYGGGLNRLDPVRGVFSHVTEEDGLPNNVVYGILPDGQGNLWLTTNKGVARFSPATGQCRNYDVNDGLQGNEFNQGSYFRATDGEMFIGGINGVNIFYPDSIRENTVVPPVYLTSFRVFDRPVVLEKALPAVRSIGLSYAQNFFSFEFVALNYTSPLKNRYAYMLEGLDDEWIDAGGRRYVSYTNLDPGSYVLRVRASNNDGIWNTEGVTVQIEITPPYWGTWWFRSLAVLAFIGILFLMYRVRVNKLLAIERIRASIATDLHDDIGSTLTEIALFTDLGRRELAAEVPAAGEIPPSGAHRVAGLLEEIGVTSRNLIDAMNDIVWSIDPKNDSFDVLLLRMKTHAARMFEARGVNYAIDIPPEVSRLKLPLGFRRSFFLIFKEAINNILRHAHPTEVTMAVRHERRSLVMVIRDDGVGFDPTGPRQGNGLRNMRGRAQALNGELAVTSSPGVGTTISLRVPIP